MTQWMRYVLYLVVLVLAFVLARNTAQAQARYRIPYQEPQWFTFHLSEVSAGVYAEGTWQESSFKKSDTSVSYEHFFAGPTLGLACNGSIYHPNLVQYSIYTDGALGWLEDTVSSGGITTTRKELDYLGHFSGSLDFLQGKPYRASVFSSYDHTYRDADFFTRVTVESLRYGARASWGNGPWEISADYLHRDETSTSPFPYVQVVSGTNGSNTGTNQYIIDQKTSTLDDTVTVAARNARDRGGSQLSYNLDQFTRTDYGSQTTSGTTQTISAGDSEQLGSREQVKFNTSASFTHRDTSFELSDEVLANAFATIEHGHSLSSYYDLSYDYYTSTDYTSDSFSGSASLQHQLYSSLTSVFSVRGSDVETSQQTFDGYNRRYGAGFTESYRKDLSDTTTLHVNNSLFVDQVAQKNTGTIQNEPHQILPTGEGGAPPNSFFLDFPLVLTDTIVITDTARTFQFLAGFDYLVVVLGSRTQIEWLSPPGRPAPHNVLASYQTEPTPAAQYQIFSEGFFVRLDFWKDLFGVYVRGNLSLNNAPVDLHISDFTDYAAGADVRWRFLRAGAEYELYDSTDASYRAARFYQSLAFRPDERSTLSLDFTELFLQYTSVNREEQDYRFIAQYRHELTSHLSFDASAGVDNRRGQGVDQLLATVRPSLRYHIGKTSLDVGYDFEYQLYLDNEERIKNMLFLTLKRVF